MKILIVHTLYKQMGGEEITVDNEFALLSRDNVVDKLIFNNCKLSSLKFLFASFNPFSYFRLVRKIKTFRPTVLHIHNWHFAASPSIIMAAKRYGVHVVCTIHNYRLICPSGTLLSNGELFLKSIDENFPWSAVYKKVYRNSFFQTFWLAFIVWLHKKLGTWRSVDKFIVLTENAKDLLLSSTLNLSRSQVVVKPNFVNELEVEKQKREDFFLYVGRLSEEKGIDLLLDSFSRNKYCLKIVGDGPKKDFVATASEENQSIRYLGRQTRSSIFNEMQRCAALVFPSVWYEGMPLTIIEAFANGVPVIASRMGAMACMIEDGYNGLLFEPGNARDFTDKLKYWVDLSKEDREVYYANARKSFLDNYTDQTNKQQILAIYNSIIAQENSQSAKPKTL